MLPSIRIVEPGPYRPNQTVTVEVRDARDAGDFPVAWCQGDRPCGYKAGQVSGDVTTVSWQLPSSASDCSDNRCYFGIASGGEGLPPPAIVIVNMTE